MTGGGPEPESPGAGSGSCDSSDRWFLERNNYHQPQPAVCPRRRILNPIESTAKHGSNHIADFDNEHEFHQQQHNKSTQYFRSEIATNTNDGEHINSRLEDFDQSDETASRDDQDDILSDALLAVASAEEYAAKIIKLQQACLTPLKEDLADWLNKILNTSNITTDNFMDKLDNGVIICRLAKTISAWCEQQITNSTTTPTSLSNVHSPVMLNHQGSTAEQIRSQQNQISRHPHNQHQDNLSFHLNDDGSLRAVSRSTNCLTTATMTAITTAASSSTVNNGLYTCSNQFINNLIKMDQTKIWEDAKGRTFYARDNVCNFIKWSKEFGVNQSVLFESDDLVLHANPRQVILCLLDVARIAYVKYGFTEAPGLVKFEQEIDREMDAERAVADLNSRNCAGEVESRKMILNDGQSAAMDSGRARSSLGETIAADPTDQLIMRYCKHKEEEAARKKNDELEAARMTAETAAAAAKASEEARAAAAATELARQAALEQSDDAIRIQETTILGDSLMTDEAYKEFEDQMKSALNGLTAHKPNSRLDNRVDSLDSGEGNTESASTSHSQGKAGNTTEIRTPTKSTMAVKDFSTTNFNPASLASNRTSSMTASELSSSVSSLLSGQDGGASLTTTPKRQITSDLDGKVMRIAKSYYGKGATQGVTRLSEGKYKIADRIVFVRLLKGQRVMVRIGGGWDTLENFLFRHKSDPSQVIDVDNLLPLESKMSFDNSPQMTPTSGNNKQTPNTKLPYYRRSNSASSTNLSATFLSASNHSIASSVVPSTLDGMAKTFSPPDSPYHHQHPLTPTNVRHQGTKQIPHFLTSKGTITHLKHLNSNSAYFDHNYIPQNTYLKSPKTTPTKTPYSSNKQSNHFGFNLSKTTPTSSATHLNQSTTSRQTSGIKAPGEVGKTQNSTNNLQNGNTRSLKNQQTIFKKLGQSNDSINTYYKSPYHQQFQISRQQTNKLNGSSANSNNVNGNLRANKRRLEQQRHGSKESGSSLSIRQ